jgi:hypothetical protein
MQSARHFQDLVGTKSDKFKYQVNKLKIAFKN